MFWREKVYEWGSQKRTPKTLRKPPKTPFWGPFFALLGVLFETPQNTPKTLKRPEKSIQKRPRTGGWGTTFRKCVHAFWGT